MRYMRGNLPKGGLGGGGSLAPHAPPGVSAPAMLISLSVSNHPCKRLMHGCDKVKHTICTTMTAVEPMRQPGAS